MIISIRKYTGRETNIIFRFTCSNERERESENDGEKERKTLDRIQRLDKRGRCRGPS